MNTLFLCLRNYLQPYRWQAVLKVGSVPGLSTDDSVSECPIFSRTFTKSEHYYLQNKKEVLSLIHGVKNSIVTFMTIILP